MSAQNEFKYYAFISYNHRDEKIAKWLQLRLQQYRLPSVARKEIGEDVRIRPVFRYVVNLSLGVLRDQIKKELDASRYLIVICSPNSAKPNIKGEHWVNDEVERFIKLGRKDNIIPVIIDGEPNSGDDRECFPPALRDAGIVGANLNKTRKRFERRNDFLKIVAKLLGILPDQLIRHVEAEEVRRRRLKWFMRLPLFILLFAAGLFVWDSTRLVTRYYADYVDSFGLPEGIFELSDEQIAGRNFHYRFEFKGYQYGDSPHADSARLSLLGFRRKLVRVVQASSSGFPKEIEDTEYKNRPQIQDFEYDKYNRLIKILQGHYNGEGEQPILKKRLEFYNENGVTNGLVKFFASQEGQLSTSYLNSYLTSQRNDFAGISYVSEIMQSLLIRDGRGRIKRLLFLNSQGVNVSNADGMSGIDYCYDDIGRKTEEWYLRSCKNSFERCCNIVGVAGCKYSYCKDFIKRVEYVNSNGMPTLNQYGWMVREVIKYDEIGNIYCLVYKNEKGQEMCSWDGYAKCHMEYDVRGFKIREQYYGIDDKLVLCKEGYAGWRRWYDLRGNPTNICFYGVNDSLINCKAGYAIMHVGYDVRDFKIREQYYGVDYKPIFSKDGIAGWQRWYDLRGNPTNMCFYGVDGNLSLSNNGYAIMRMEYDACGYRIREQYYSIENKPILSRDGVAGHRVWYDLRGNPTNMCFYGVDDRPILCKDGYARLSIDYSAQGDAKCISYRDEDGALSRTSFGWAEIRFESVSRGSGLIKKISWYDENGKLTAPFNRSAVISTELDENGKVIEVKSFDIYGKELFK